jgi:hypothetical protein
MASRQVRRAQERLHRKMASPKYPLGLFQRHEPFQPRGINYRDGRPLGVQEAARRLRRSAEA